MGQLNAFVQANNPGTTDTISFSNVPPSGTVTGGAACGTPSLTSESSSLAAVSGKLDAPDAGADSDLPSEAPVQAENIDGGPSVSLPQTVAAAQPLLLGVSKRDGGTTLRHTAADAPLRVEALDAERVAARETEDAPRAANASPHAAAARTAALTGETVSVQIGTLPAGETVTITFQVTISNTLPSGTSQVSNQGTVSGSNFTSVLTDDPDTAAPNDPTVTPVLTPPDIKVNDAKVVEPTSGTADALFTVTLSHAFTAPVTVNFTTAEDAPPGAGKATAGSDYTTTNGTVTFPAGETFRTISVPVLTDGSGEPDETFLVNLSSPTNGTITDGQAVGTITETRAPGAVLISELRTSGPGTGTGGEADDFVELYNNSDSPVDISNWSIVKSGGTCDAAPVVVAGIGPSTVIPARGNYLLTGGAYSLGGYSAGDQTIPADIEADRNVALFNTSDATAFGSTTVVDAVGFGTGTGGNCNLLREGNTLTGAANAASDYSFVREVAQGATADTGDNAADFALVSTTPAVLVGGVTPLLGAPGPESSTKPRGPVPCAANPTYEIGRALLDTAVGADAEPNRKRDTTPDAGNNSTAGTLEFRRTFTNNTGGSLTALRFRIVDLTNSPSGPEADLRARSSSAGMVTRSDMTMVNVGGTTLEQPPTQTNGGGINSSLAVAAGLPLADGASVNLRFLFGVQRVGNYRVGFVIETLSVGGTIGQDIWVLTGHTETGGDAERACNAPPDVDAGEDQTVECAGASTTVTLSGTATDPENDVPLTFEWFEGNMSLGTGETLENVSLAFGQHTITLKVTDSQGNVGEDTVIVNVVDTTGPTFTDTPPPVTLQTGAGATSCGVTVSDLDVTLGTATATDSCGGNAVTVERLGVPAGNVFPVGETVVTYKATDAAGNMAMFQQTVTVEDNTVPTITAPANLTDVSADADVCAATNVNLGTPTTGDNCPLPPDAVTNDAPASFPLGTTTVTWKVTDAAGNMATATQTVTVVDKQKPSVTAPAPVTLQTGEGALSCGVTVSDLDATLGT
ncbi:MAG TPA: HYR domain-containing protein, partial [Pyrinomonadaceae bacterium]